MSRPALPFARLSHPWQWAVLAAGSLALAAGLELLRLPAALLLGPMAAAIALETGGGSIRLPLSARSFCQMVIGCMVARVLTPGIGTEFLHRWPLLLGIVLSLIAASSLLGWLLSRWGVLPGTTAVWGLSPGAASAMVLMAGSFGADARLVAFMQYLRVVIVATLATLVARFWGVQGSAPAHVWFPALHGAAFVETLSIALVGGLLGRAVRLPAGLFLGPMILGAVLHGAGWVAIELPPWLLAASYALLGWTIGLGFTREILGHALRALPMIVAAILALLLFAGGLAFLLVKEFGVDPLTAYLATSPGGADSVAIIASASNGVDVSFVMALQIVRFLLLLVIGPTVSRFAAGKIGTQPSAGPGEGSKIVQQVREDEGDLD